MSPAGSIEKTAQPIALSTSVAMMPPCMVPIGFSCISSATTENTTRPALDLVEPHAEQRGGRRRGGRAARHRAQLLCTRRGRAGRKRRAARVGPADRARADTFSCECRWASRSCVTAVPSDSARNVSTYAERCAMTRSMWAGSSYRRAEHQPAFERAGEHRRQRVRIGAGATRAGRDAVLDDAADQAVPRASSTRGPGRAARRGCRRPRSRCS